MVRGGLLVCVGYAHTARAGVNSPTRQLACCNNLAEADDDDDDGSRWAAVGTRVRQGEVLVGLKQSLASCLSPRRASTSMLLDTALESMPHS